MVTDTLALLSFPQLVTSSVIQHIILKYLVTNPLIEYTVDSGGLGMKAGTTTENGIAEQNLVSRLHKPVRTKLTKNKSGTFKQTGNMFI